VNTDGFDLWEDVESKTICKAFQKLFVSIICQILKTEQCNTKAVFKASIEKYVIFSNMFFIENTFSL